MIGGVESVEVLLEQGPSSDVMPDLPEERQFPVVTSIEDKVFLCGGTDSTGFVAKETCFYYSFWKGEWIEMKEKIMPNGPISRSAGVSAYGDFYILGGQTQDGQPTDKVEILDGNHEQWFSGPSMPIKLSGHCAIRDWDLIYVLGSNVAFGDFLEVLVFNITSTQWEILPISNPPGSKRPLARMDFACALSPDKDQIYVSGGQQLQESDDDFYSFSIANQTWHHLPNSSQPRTGHVMTFYRNQLTVIGRKFTKFRFQI